jgi:6-pyruvoyl-tetrahydropterin synthase
MKVFVSHSRIALNTEDLQKATPLHLAIVSDHPAMVKYLLDQEITSITDNKFGQNALDVAIALDKENCASQIIKHERWEQAMKPLSSSSKTQLQLLVEKIPELAMVVMDKSIVTSEEKNTIKRKFDFQYINGVTDPVVPIQSRAATEMLKAALKFNRTSCMAHSLCVEFLNSKWRKFGAFIIITNLTVYLLFLLLLMGLIIQFPTYTESPFCHIELVEVLLRILQPLNSNVTSTSSTLSLTVLQKMEFCYGNPSLRIAVVVSVFLGLLKETVPLFYQRLAYFRKLSNVLELAVYIITLIFLDPFGLIVESFDVPAVPCPKGVWVVGALAVFLAWLVLLLNMQRLVP